MRHPIRSDDIVVRKTDEWSKFSVEWQATSASGQRAVTRMTARPTRSALMAAIIRLPHMNGLPLCTDS
jgi:hypothetical protein